MQYKQGRPSVLSQGLLLKIVSNEWVITLTNISGENGQQPMGDYKSQLTGKYERKFSVSNISHVKLIIYIRKSTTVNILGYISYQEI